MALYLNVERRRRGFKGGEATRHYATGSALWAEHGATLRCNDNESADMSRPQAPDCSRREMSSAWARENSSPRCFSAMDSTRGRLSAVPLLQASA